MLHIASAIMKFFPASEIKFHERTPQTIPRPKPMKVLVLSVSRTGNASMYTALKKLGMNPYHFAEAIRNINNGHCDLWLKAVQCKYDGIGIPFEGQDFDQMLWNYDAVTDAPCCLFVQELINAYPDAKVVLTTRTKESWLNSMRQTLLLTISWRSWTALSYLDPEFSGPYWRLYDRATRVWSKNLPPYEEDSFPALVESFEEHNAHVREVVPAERLLEFHPSDGWEPLCKFLEVVVPEGKFPNVNDGKYFIGHHSSLYWRRWFHVLLNMGKVVVVGSLAVGLHRVMK
ncbi:hypothetical protein BJ170DRAFT_247506 [Xylariales sp. AK1849]|nr:hypothetical protein BJ170DRAFT_247506 [Xylariales sp. AK1849]